MGHGLTAAVFTVEIRFILRALLRAYERPSVVLDHLNTYLLESRRLFREGLKDEGDESPISLTLAVIHTATGKGVVAVAGMEPPLLVRADGAMEEIQVFGLLLGVEGDQDYRAAEFQLEPEDSILMTTDGITEQRQGKEFLGAEGLQRLVQEAQPLGTLEKTAQTISPPAARMGRPFGRRRTCIMKPKGMLRRRRSGIRTAAAK